MKEKWELLARVLVFWRRSGSGRRKRELKEKATGESMPIDTAS